VVRRRSAFAGAAGDEDGDRRLAIGTATAPSADTTALRSASAMNGRSG
jgi:hypothetical protein